MRKIVVGFQSTVTDHMKQMVGLNGRWNSHSSSCASGIDAVGIDCVWR